VTGVFDKALAAQPVVKLTAVLTELVHRLLVQFGLLCTRPELEHHVLDPVDRGIRMGTENAADLVRTPAVHAHSIGTGCAEIEQPGLRLDLVPGMSESSRSTTASGTALAKSSFGRPLRPALGAVLMRVTGSLEVAGAAVAHVEHRSPPLCFHQGCTPTGYLGTFGLVMTMTEFARGR
jgi:hypothetical protein